jgi:Ca2+-binding RTX toxin-like protein
MRYQKNVYTGESMGPERFPFNTSPIQGAITGQAGIDRWLYVNVYNAVTGDTYLCACRPPQPGERSFGPPVNYYPLHKFASRSNYLANIGKYGGRTNDTLMGGSGSDVFWMTMGRLAREIDDTNYRYAASGTLYLTELRRNPHQLKKLRWIELEASGCSSTKTLTVSVTTQDERGLSKTVQIGYVIKTDGIHRLQVPSGEEVVSRRLKLQVAFASDDSSASPQITDNIIVGYELMPLEIGGETLEGE